jgi:hypothetical protein
MNVVANYLRSRDRGVVVWLAHSEELCEQAWDEFQKAWSALGIRDVQLIRFWGPYEADLRTITDGVVIAGLKKCGDNKAAQKALEVAKDKRKAELSVMVQS